MFAGCWGCIRGGGVIFSLFCPRGSHGGFPRLFTFCWGTRKMREAVFRFLGLLEESWGFGWVLLWGSWAMTFSDPTAHSSPLFYDLKILKLDDLYQLSISVFAYECQNNITPLYFVNFFTQTTDVHSYNTRSAARGDFFILQRNTQQYGL